MGSFRFKQFEVSNSLSALKVGTDAVVLGAAASIEGSRSILDIGTGTGIIALMLAQRCPEADIEAIEIDPLAAKEAEGNFAESPWSERMRALNVALKDYIPSQSFDLIVSNPPYYDLSLKNKNARVVSTRHTESLSYREIFAFAEKFLSPEGRVSLIMPYDSLSALCREARSRGLFEKRIVKIKTVERKPFKRVVAEFSRQRVKEPIVEELTLQEEGQRTAQFDALVRDFYL